MIDWNKTGDEATRLLSEYLKIQSVNPPGNEVEAADFISARLRDIGLEPQVFSSGPGRSNVTARLRGNGTGRPILLYHHMDVVAADPERWSCDPFGGEIHNGYVWGRGAIDMKGMGIMQLLALDLLKKYVPERKSDIIFFAAADEEGGGIWGTRWMMDNHPDEIDAGLVWDEGGFGMTGIFGPRPVFTVAVAEKKNLWVKLTARGEPGHSGMPGGDNAAETLVRALGRLSGVTGGYELTPVTRGLFRAVSSLMPFPGSFLLRWANNPLVFRILVKVLAGNRTLAAMLKDTLSVTVLRAGDKENVIPDRAEAVLDIRLLPNRDPEEVMSRLKRLMDEEQIDCKVLQSPQESSISPVNSGFFRTLSEVMGELVPEGVVAPMMTPGTTDSCYFRRRGVPSYGLFPIIINPDELSRFHGIDERISIENLCLGTRVFFEVLRRLGR